MRLLLVRHGQTDANLHRRIQGQSDGELNAAGIAQVEALAASLKDTPLDAILSSPLRRARHTAEAIARYHRLNVLVTPLLAEWNCGALDGLPAEEFRALLKQSGLPLAQFRPPGGETLSEVRQRAEDFLAGLAAFPPGRTVLVCSHGDLLRALLSVLQQVEAEATAGVYFENAAVTTLEQQGGGWRLVEMNRLP
jgi:broad specificity phosphatase PhoE